MEISELLKDSLKYPVSDWNKILIIGILTLLIEMIFSLGVTIAITLKIPLIAPVVIVLSIMVWFIINGYYLSVIRDSINLKNKVPSFNIKENLGDGAYLFVIELILAIIPFIIFLLIGYFTGTFDLIMNTIMNTYSSSVTSVNIDYNMIMKIFNSGFVITLIVSFILGIIYSLITNIAVCRYGKTGKFKEGLNIVKIFKDISKIGWSDYIIWFILIMIINCIFGVILSFITSIPIIGVFINVLIISPYLMIFLARALGLIYTNA